MKQPELREMSSSVRDMTGQPSSSLSDRHAVRPLRRFRLRGGRWAMRSWVRCGTTGRIPPFATAPAQPDLRRGPGAAPRAGPVPGPIGGRRALRGRAAPADGPGGRGQPRAGPPGEGPGQPELHGQPGAGRFADRPVRDHARPDLAQGPRQVQDQARGRAHLARRHPAPGPAGRQALGARRSPSWSPIAVLGGVPARAARTTTSTRPPR